MCEQILGCISFSTTDKYKTVFKENYFHRRSSKHSRTPMVNIWCLSHWLPPRIEPVPYPNSTQMQRGWMTTEAPIISPRNTSDTFCFLTLSFKKPSPVLSTAVASRLQNNSRSFYSMQAASDSTKSL